MMMTIAQQLNQVTNPADNPPEGTRRIVDGLERVFYDGYWIKTYKDFKPGEHAAPAPVQVNAPGDGAAAGGRRRGGREARMGRG